MRPSGGGRRRCWGRFGFLPILFALVLGFALTPAVERAQAQHAAPVDSVPGVQIRVAVFEKLTADSVEDALIDSLAADLRFGRETTLRAGNFVMYLTVTPARGGAVTLEYGVFVPGPSPQTMYDRATVEHDLPVVIDSIKGKGKSTFRALVFAHPIFVRPTPPPATSDTSGWQILPSEDFVFHLPPGSLAAFHFLGLRDALEAEFKQAEDTLGFGMTRRMTFVAVEGASDDFPYDPRYNFAVDPPRNRIVARYDKSASGVDIRAVLLMNLFATWGYAPDLLSIGTAGLLGFADHDVINDAARGSVIPLDSLVRTLDFKRHDAQAAAHHAASFVRWLIITRGIRSFREFYGRSTDLSLRRAVWSVYGKTLSELEQEWRAYLKKRRFIFPEFTYFAGKARAYRRYDEYMALLREAVAVADTAHFGLYQDLGMAHAQLGRWDDAVDAFRQLVGRYPGRAEYHWDLAEALWATGNEAASTWELAEVRSADADDPRPWLRWGDMQYLAQRADSAAALWRRGLAMAKGPRTTMELLLRLGNYEKVHQRHADSATSMFMYARRTADQMLQDDPGNASLWVFAGESLLGLDSVGAAIDHFQTARYLADMPVDLGRICVDLGNCYDLSGQRQEAVREYERVFASPSAYADRAAAQYYINHHYRR